MIAGCVFLMVHLDFRSFLLFAMVRRVYKFARYSAKRNIKKSMGGLITIFSCYTVRVVLELKKFSDEK